MSEITLAFNNKLFTFAVTNETTIMSYESGKELKKLVATLQVDENNHSTVEQFIKDDMTNVVKDQYNRRWKIDGWFLDSDPLQTRFKYEVVLIEMEGG